MQWSVVAGLNKQRQRIRSPIKVQLTSCSVFPFCDCVLIMQTLQRSSSVRTKIYEAIFQSTIIFYFFLLSYSIELPRRGAPAIQLQTTEPVKTGGKLVHSCSLVKPSRLQLLIFFYSQVKNIVPTLDWLELFPLQRHGSSSMGTGKHYLVKCRLSSWRLLFSFNYHCRL